MSYVISFRFRCWSCEVLRIQSGCYRRLDSTTSAFCERGAGLCQPVGGANPSSPTIEFPQFSWTRSTFDKIFFENFINDRKHPVPVEDLIELGIIPATRTASLPVYEETQDIDKQFSEYDVPHFGPCHDRPNPNEVPNFADPPSDSEGSGRHGHQRHDRRPPLRHFPAWVTDLWHLLQSDGATEHLEEGPVIYLGSYYVSHETCPRQNERRPIRLDRHYESWAQQIVQVWHDHFDHSRGFELHLVAPEPPIPVTHGIVGIILIVQHPVRGQEAVLTTTVYDALDGRHMTESAHSMPRLVEPSIVLERAGALARCRAVESQGFGPCYIRSGPHVFNRHQPLRCHDGLGLVIRIPELQPDDDDEIQTIEQLRREDRNAEPPGETDEVQMMARQPRLRESSTSPSTSSSDTTCSMASDSWQRTVIFAIDGSVRSLMLPQNDDHLIRSRIAAEFELEPHEIHNVFPVNERPDDLVEMELQGQLLQTIRDHRHPPIMRLLLVDIEVFIEQEILPFAFRRNTMWLPHTATRLTLLRLLGVGKPLPTSWAGMQSLAQQWSSPSWYLTSFAFEWWWLRSYFHWQWRPDAMPKPWHGRLCPPTNCACGTIENDWFSPKVHVPAKM